VTNPKRWNISPGFKAALRWLACVAVVVGVTYALRKNIRALAQEWPKVHVSFPMVLASGASLAATSVVQLVIFRQLLQAYHGRLSWRAMVVVSWIPTLAKYIPVKVGALAGTVYLLGRQGVPAIIAVSVALIQDMLAIIAGLMVASPIVHGALLHSPMPVWLWRILVMALGLIFLHPAVFPRMANLILRLLRRPMLPTNIPVRNYAAPVLITFGQWFFTGLALWCLTRSVVGPALPLVQAPFFMEVAALAFAVGYLAFFTLGGLGVREPILILALTSVVGLTNATIVAIAMRMLQTVVELILLLIALLVWRTMKTLAETQQPVV